MGFVRSLQLTNFRCYESVRLDDLSSGPIVLYGANGAGKTNILEALSLLASGRGLRSAKTSQMQRNGSSRAQQPWAISCGVSSQYGDVQIGTGADPQKERRVVRINGEPAKNQAAMAEYLSCVWLTPQMDRLFMDGASGRRRFLDRLIFAFDAGHMGRVTRYEKALSQRSKILKEHDSPDDVWLAALESSMAETGVAISAARLDFVQRLQVSCDRTDMAESFLFPKARLAATGTIEELLMNSSALEVEDLFKYQLVQTRSQDAITGGAATGAHKSDLAVTYRAKDMPAAHCSTGEQKALLIGIVIAHSRLIAAERGAPPILLLDEVAAHLDENRRAGLYDILWGLKAQVWMTGTDENLFTALGDKAQRFEIKDAAIASEKAVQVA